jgi:hypothetical protein
VRVLNPERRVKKPPGEKRKQKKGAQKGTLWVYVGDESTVFDYCNPAREMDRSGSWKGIADTCRPTDFPDTGRFTAGEASPRLRAWRMRGGSFMTRDRTIAGGAGMPSIGSASSTRSSVI